MRKQLERAKNRWSVAVNDKESNNANKMSDHDTEAKILTDKEDIEPLQALIRKQTESSTKKRNGTYSQKNQNYPLYDSATHNKNIVQPPQAKNIYSKIHIIMTTSKAY